MRVGDVAGNICVSRPPFTSAFATAAVSYGAGYRTPRCLQRRRAVLLNCKQVGIRILEGTRFPPLHYSNNASPSLGSAAVLWRRARAPGDAHPTRNPSVYPMICRTAKRRVPAPAAAAEAAAAGAGGCARKPRSKKTKTCVAPPRHREGTQSEDRWP